ncbi:MAG: glycoside hydrolase family 44 protein [Pseudomonadota bacterium]
MTHFFLSMITFLLFMGVAPSNPEVVSIEAKVDSKPTLPLDKINPGIYGIGTYFGESKNDLETWALKPEVFRLGGNSSERFNWKTNSWNTGKDWYFRNFNSSTPSVVDAFMKANRDHGVGSLITIPMLGWIAKDQSSGSYPISKYPHQKDQREGFGNGMAKSGDPLKADPNLANTPLSSEYISSWVSHLKTQFGNHPHRYIIGNEPMLWHETHQDVHPNRATYEEVLNKFLTTSHLVRKADPEAVIFGPALWGYLAVKQSAFDAPGPWSQGQRLSDKKKHGGVDFLEWFLKEVAKEEKRSGVSLLDVVDVHFYPEGDHVRNSPPSLPTSRQARLEATRSLWDPSYKDPSWIDEKIYFIPYIKGIIAKSSPKLKFAIGEYKFYGEEDIAGGIALAEVLGIFSKEKLDYASYWTIPPPKSPASFAFKLFRNYDGKGSAFGDILIPNTYGTQKDASLFSALREADQTLTLVLLNKSQTKTATFDLNISGLNEKTSFTLYKFNPTSGSIEPTSLASLKMRPSLPPLSMALLEIKRAKNKVDKK